MLLSVVIQQHPATSNPTLYALQTHMHTHTDTHAFFAYLSLSLSLCISCFLALNVRISWLFAILNSGILSWELFSKILIFPFYLCLLTQFFLILLPFPQCMSHYCSYLFLPWLLFVFSCPPRRLKFVFIIFIISAEFKYVITLIHMYFTSWKYIASVIFHIVCWSRC